MLLLILSIRGDLYTVVSITSFTVGMSIAGKGTLRFPIFIFKSFLAEKLTTYGLYVVLGVIHLT